MAVDSMVRPMMAAMMIAVMGSLILPLLAQAAPPSPTYCCPIHERLGDPVCFYTLADLEAHFTTDHPSVAIDIVWE